MSTPEREVLKTSLKILDKVFKEWVRVERRTSGLFKNRGGNWVRIGKTSEPDIGGYIIKGPYIAKPLVIEVKRADFRPSRVYKKDKKRFIDQCKYLQDINEKGGVGFWINNSSLLYGVLMPVLMHGAKVSIDVNYSVIVTRPKVIKATLKSVPT